MNNILTEDIKNQTEKALWELRNVIDCIPDELWSREYCEMPLYKHVYHTLHSLDLWYINPNDSGYQEPEIHIKDLNDLDVRTDKFISKVDCSHTRLELILGQFRHLHTHMGMIMGFIIEATGMWPTVLGLERPIPQGDDYNKFC